MTRANSQSASGVQSLAERHLVEETFHDEKAYVGAPPARTDFYPEWMGEEHMEMLLRAAGPLKGKRVLDFGCGRGETSRLYAQEGAIRVDGFDISGENIHIAEKNAARDGMNDRVFFRRLAAEDIDYADQSFDVVIGKAILHHTDLDKTARQLHRVLADGGIAVFLEPLSHNPLLNLFRRLTPSRRTPTEQPLSVKSLRIFRRYFASVTYRGVYLFTLLAHMMLMLTGGRSLFMKTHALMRQWEDPVLRRIPGLQRYCWSAVLIFRRDNEIPRPATWPQGQIEVR